MRRVSCTVPGMLDGSTMAVGDALSSAALLEVAGAHTAMTAAVAVSPVLRRNDRRVGFGGDDCGSSGIEPPFPTNNSSVQTSGGSFTVQNGYARFMPREAAIASKKLGNCWHRVVGSEWLIATRDHRYAC